jgi:hypothetical protein
MFYLPLVLLPESLALEYTLLLGSGEKRIPARCENMGKSNSQVY